MKKIVIYIGTVLAAMLLTTSCQHETDPFDGPSLIDQFGAFRLVDSLAVSQEQADFATGENIVFTASFNKNVNWELTITGRESGAVKLIEGFSGELDMDNANWDGGASDAPLFRAEMCDVTLLVPSEDSLLLTTEVEALSGKSYDDAIIALDFETDLGASYVLGNFEFEFSGETGIKDDGMAGQGDKYFFFEGTDNVVANFFCGLIRVDPGFGGNTYFPTPSPDPADVYVNFFIWHDKTPHTIAVINYFIDTNDDGVFTEGVDQARKLAGDFPLDHIGWKMFSHTMADMGMTAEEMEKIVTIEIVLISNMNGQPNPPQPVRYGIDFITFTSGQPLEL